MSGNPPSGELGSMSPDKAQAIWKRAPRIHGPRFLAHKWAIRTNPNPSVEKFISDMREAVLSPELDDPEKLHAYTARFVEALIQRFERLVETGKLDGVLPRLAGLPILYSPNAGKGAGRWEYAARLCKEKRVGSESLLEYRDTDSALARNPIWRHLAHDT